MSISLATNSVALRALCALPFVLVAPGYAIAAAIFPRHALGVPERLLLSLGLSLAVAALGGLVLNWTPWGLQTSSWLVWLGAITLGAGAVALVRHRAPSPVAIDRAHSRLSVRDMLLVGLAVLVGTTAVVVARTPTPQQGFQGYTILWLLPADDRQDAVRLGVSSMEFTATSYRLRVEVNGTLVREWPTIALEPGQNWEMTIALPAPPSGAQQVQAVLYRTDAPGVIYRRTVLWRGKESE